MSSISGNVTFEVTDYLQPQLLGIGSFQLARSQLVDFSFDLGGFHFDETGMSCQCYIEPGGLFDIALQGPAGLFVWDFEHEVFAIDFSHGWTTVSGNSETGTVSGVLTSNTLHEVPSDAGIYMFLAALVVLIGRRIAPAGY